MTSQTLSSTNGHRPAQQCQAPANTARPSVIQMLREADAAERSHHQLPAAGFSPGQIAALSAPLNRAHISSREQGRGRVSYLQSFVVLQEANRIFGFDGWQRQTLLCRCVSQAERLIGGEQKAGWGVTYIARVRITVSAGGRGPLVREGTGAGHGIDTDLGLAHESAIKEAETDATKRALVTFGNPFGLALYDKSQQQVSGGGDRLHGSQRLRHRARGRRQMTSPPLPGLLSHRLDLLCSGQATPQPTGQAPRHPRPPSRWCGTPPGKPSQLPSMDHQGGMGCRVRPPAHRPARHPARRLPWSPPPSLRCRSGSGPWPMATARPSPAPFARPSRCQRPPHQWRG